jgi:lipid-binding SYLF domain-containing protein
MRGALLGAAIGLLTANLVAEVNTSPKARLAAAARVVRQTQVVIPADYWNKARCIAAFPEVSNLDFVVGGTYARGVMSCRRGDRWSAPAFVSFHKGSRTSQLGAALDIVLLFMNDGVAQQLTRQTVTLGADALTAPGPIDTQARVDLTTARADILTYTRAKGLMMNLSGSALREDDDANEAIYGKQASLRTILATGDVRVAEGAAFVAAVSIQPSAPAVFAMPPAVTAAAAPPTRLPVATPRLTTDEDLRARLADVQQMLDRMLGNTTSVPVGTSGVVGGGAVGETIPVSRERLLQLRGEVNALLAALNQR